MMKQIELEEFYVIGITMRTTNENGQAGRDIPKHWQKFMTEGIANKIPNKASEEIFCIYTEYEGDHNHPYTTVIGCQVKTLENVPNGMRAFTFKKSMYMPFQAQGNLMEGAVINAWYKIWQQELDRSYLADFEVYGEKAKDPSNATVDIYIGLNN